jgi:hypothetical protein
MATPDPQSVVHVQTYADSKAAITLTGKGGTLTLDVFTDGPTIAINDPARGEHPLKACVALKANGNLRGFFVKKPEEGADRGHLVWFPAQKQRAKK